jgi:hypothetical protein
MKVVIFTKDEIDSRAKGDIQSPVAFKRTLARLIAFFEEYKIAWEFYSRETKIGDDDFPVVLQADINMALAANLFNRACPVEPLMNLMSKKDIGPTLNKYGFGLLPQRIIKSMDEITEEDGSFILKPAMFSQGTKDSFGKAPDTKWYHNREALISHKLDLSEGVLLQKAVVDEKTNQSTVVCFFGTINERNEVQFIRTAISKRDARTLDPITYIPQSYYRDFDHYSHGKEFFQKYVSDTGLRNLPFTLQCMLDEDGYTLYPTDFNPKIGFWPFMWMEFYAPEESFWYLGHLFGIETGLGPTKISDMAKRVAPVNYLTLE